MKVLLKIYKYGEGIYYYEFNNVTTLRLLEQVSSSDGSYEPIQIFTNNEDISHFTLLDELEPGNEMDIEAYVVNDVIKHKYNVTLNYDEKEDLITSVVEEVGL
jgi:hypothetical protein